MNKRLVKYVGIANQLRQSGCDINQIIAELKINDATYAITFRTLEEIGYHTDDIDDIISQSRIWEGFTRSVGDMFFDFVELDNDLLEDDDPTGYTINLRKDRKALKWFDAINIFKKRSSK